METIRRSRILVVEDEGIVAVDLEDRLTRLGYEVIAAVDSGEKAIKRASDLPQPDLILMDIMLKGPMNGIEAAQQIQDQLHLPVIYLTASSEDATLQRAMVTGAYSYLLKPFQEKELKTNIEMALYKHKMEQEREEILLELEETLAQVKTLRGLLPICTWCKRIRDDKGYWDDVENYVGKHTDAHFTHGVCPACGTSTHLQCYYDFVERGDKTG